VAGYTPIFDSVFQGSLCGKWPDIGIWALMLAMQDKNGEIDAHPSYIALVTGCPVDQVESAITRFCEPDPSSRTPDEDGRRLIPIPGRGFGWTVVNHRKYREKARKSSFDAQRSADGRNAERMKTRADPRAPALTRADPPSDSDTNTDKKKTYVGQEPDVVRVFDHWKTVHGKSRSKLDDKRRKLIRSALKNYSADVLCQCIDGYKRSEWHQGKNERRTVYDDIELMLRDAKQIDAGLTYVEKGAQIQW
jgi:hypothetical protein